MSAAATAIPMPDPLPPAPVTFAALAARIAADPALPAWRRHYDPGALRALCAHLGLDPATTPADLRPLRSRIKAFRPRRAGISPKYWSTVLSAVRRSLRYGGLVCPPKRSVTPLSPAWAALLARADPRDRELVRLRRFARWCTARGTAPEDVDQAELDAFQDELAASGVDAAGAGRAVIRAWTRAAAAVPGWPQARLGPGPHPLRWTPPLAVLAPGLRAELDAFFAWAGRDDPLDDDAPVRPLRPASVVSYRYRLRAYLGALAATGQPPAELRALADLVEPERARAALRWLRDRSATGDARGAYLAACLLRRIGEHLRLEPACFARLTELGKRLRPKARKRLAAKNRERLRLLRDDRHLGGLLHLPDHLMRRARRADPDDRRAALLAQTAFAIALLLSAPIRLANLVSLDFDRHFVFSRSARGGRGGVVHLVIPGAETKTGEPLELELGADVVRLLREYRERFWPRLAGDGTGPAWLFPGEPPSRPKHAVTLRQQLTRAIQKHTGLTVHPHLFRHLAATLYLREHPQEFESVRLLLGHASTDTTLRFYVDADAAAAGRRFDETIAGLRAATKPAARRSRRGRR